MNQNLSGYEIFGRSPDGQIIEEIENSLDAAISRAKDLAGIFNVDVTVFAEGNPREKFAIIDGKTKEVTAL